MLDGLASGSASPPPSAAPSLFCFGKVPTYGDFVRHHATGGTVRTLERWYQEGLHNLSARMRRQSLNGAYDHAATMRFVFCPTASAELLAGALRLSRDETGRRYPFTVAAQIEKARMQPARAALLPFCDASFWQGAAGLVEEATEGTIGREALPERLDALASTCECVIDATPRRLETAQDALAAYFRETPFRTFAERIWGEFEDSRKYLVLRNLLAALQPVRRSIPARFSLGLRFPLSEEPATTAQEVSFWVRLSLRTLKSTNVTPSFFWSERHATSNATDEENSEETPPGGSALLLFFRPPPPRAFPHLLPVALKSDNICELQRSGREDAARAALELPGHYGRLLESDTATLQDFLDPL